MHGDDGGWQEGFVGLVNSFHARGNCNITLVAVSKSTCLIDNPPCLKFMIIAVLVYIQSTPSSPSALPSLQYMIMGRQFLSVSYCSTHTNHGPTIQFSFQGLPLPSVSVSLYVHMCDLNDK